MSNPRVVVCAANRWGATVVCSARHFDMRMHFQINSLNHRPLMPSNWEQGFIDQYGVFMSREEAWKVAEAAGQIRHRCGGDTKNGGTLYSENLY